MNNAYQDGTHFGVYAKGLNQFLILQTGGGYVGQSAPHGIVYYNWLTGNPPQAVVDDELDGGGGELSSAPAIVESTVAGRGMDGNIWFQEGLNGTWNPCGEQPGSLKSAPGLCKEGGNLHVFGRGVDDQLWHTYRSPGAGWSAWTGTAEGIPNLPGGMASAPSVVAPAPGRIDVVAQGNDNAVWHLYYDQGWSPQWESLGGIVTFAPTCCWWWNTPTSVFHVFAVGQDGQLWHKYFDNGWNDWTNDPPAHPNGVISSAPVAVVAGKNRVDVFARAAGAEVWKVGWTQETGWQGWIELKINSVFYPA
ncbi:MAG: hypothetical protein M3O15_02760 [Acidobacteriota bacterium]|nr:hypothetical protein [Acidobacteriota bacterium]